MRAPRGARCAFERSHGEGPLIGEGSCTRGPVQRDIPPAMLHAGDPGLGEQRRGLARPHPVLADDHDGPAVVREHRGGGGHQLHGQEQRAGDVAELLVLAGRAHVEDDRPQRQQALGLLGRHVLVRAGPAVYSDGKRGHDGP